MRKIAVLLQTLALGSILSAQQRPWAVAPKTPHAAPPSPQELFRRASSSIFVVQVRERPDRLVNATGSGVAVAPDEVVTNLHVIAAGDIWSVKRGDETWNARAAWIDPNHDLAFLRVAGLKAPPASLHRSRPLEVGERVYAIGVPEGLELTLSEGMVSGLRQYQGGYAIQTSAPISRGSSGGGLFDQEGELVGITSFGLIEGQNLNFALPAEWVETCPKRTAGGGAPQHLPEAYKEAFIGASILLGNLSEFEQAATLHGVEVPRDALSEGIDSAVNSLTLNCIFESGGPDCIENWPAWQQAAMHMLQMRVEIRAARPYEDGSADADKAPAFALRNVQSFLSEARKTWSDVTDVYCRERPGGMYTDLEDKIRACPTAR